MDDLQQDGPFQPIATAPLDGSLIIGRDASGDIFLARWRSTARILHEDGPDDQKAAQWARWHSDTPVRPIEWAPTRLKIEDVLDRA